MAINWDDPKSFVSKYFTVREAIYLPQWSRLAVKTDGLTPAAKACLEEFFLIMDGVREFLGVPVIVHVAYRSEVYNRLVGGARGSAHMARELSGMDRIWRIAACDFHAVLDHEAGITENCNLVRSMLEPRLESFGLRMEDLPDSNWVHLDNRPVLTVGQRRFFKP